MTDPPHSSHSENGQLLSSPGAPLYPLSQDQVNKSFSASARGMNELSPTRHLRTSSDVQGKVQQFNRLAQESLERKRMQEAALKRAVVGREEAEAEMRRAKEQLKLVEKDLQRARRKEKEALTRCEDVENQLEQHKGQLQKSSQSYEKEIRKISKEAFRSSSKLVTLQEDLKLSRDALKAAEVQNEKKIVALRQLSEESSTNNRKANELQTRLTALDERLALVEAENSELKKAIEEQELLRIAAEGRLALPKDDEDLLEPEAKSDTVSEEVQTVPVEEVRAEASLPYQTTVIIEVERAPVRNEWGLTAEEDLREKVEALQEQLKDREDVIEYMQIECQLKCCSCRISESSGHVFVHDSRVKSSTFAAALRSNLTVLNQQISQSAAQINVAQQKEDPVKVARVSELPKRKETIIDPFAKAAPWWTDSTSSDKPLDENKAEDPEWVTYHKTEEARLKEQRTPEWQEEEDRYSCRQRPLVIYLTKPRRETTEDELESLRVAAYEREEARADVARRAFKEKYGKDWDALAAPAPVVPIVPAVQSKKSEAEEAAEQAQEAESQEANEEMTLVLPLHLKNVSIPLPAPASIPATAADPEEPAQTSQSQALNRTLSRSVSTPAPKAHLAPNVPPATVAHAPPSPLSSGNRAYNLPPPSTMLLQSFSKHQLPFQTEFHPSRQDSSNREEQHHKRSISIEEAHAQHRSEDGRSTTRTVPLKMPFEDLELEPSTPKTMSREAALQAIKERRDRARSVGRKPAKLF